MNDEIRPAARDTIPPEAGEDFKHRSTLPPFASDKRVQDLEDKHTEVMATLGQILDRLDTLTDRVSSFHEDNRRLDERMNKLAGRVAALDGKREGQNGSTQT
jgi:chromosome segregation ATPase